MENGCGEDGEILDGDLIVDVDLCFDYDVDVKYFVFDEVLGYFFFMFLDGGLIVENVS